MTTNGVLARQLFYEGTMAYKTGDFPMAAEKFKEGLEVWKTVMDEFPSYRDDELNKKDTGLIVKRYVLALKQTRDTGPRRSAVQGAICHSSRTTPRSTRSTPSRCSASPTANASRRLRRRVGIAPRPRGPPYLAQACRRRPSKSSASATSVSNRRVSIRARRRRSRRAAA